MIPALAFAALILLAGMAWVRFDRALDRALDGAFGR